MKLFHHIKADIERAYHAHADMLYRVALTNLQSPGDAEDAVQDVFLKYMHAAAVFQSEEHERAWLIRTTVNQCRDMLRRKKQRTHLLLDDMAEILPDGGDGAAEAALEVTRALGALEENTRTVLTLHYLEGFSVEEIGKMLGISASAVKMRLSRGREAMKRKLTEEG